jgi:hypothetical protein
MHASWCATSIFHQMSRSPEHSPDFLVGEGNEEKEFSREALPVSEKFLERLYSSPKFSHALNATWLKVSKSKRQEFGFSILKDLASDATWFTKPTGGRYDEETYLPDVQNELLSRLKQKLPGKKFHIFGSLHFHHEGPPDFVIVPSALPGDVGSIRAERGQNEIETGYDLPPIEMIATSIDNGELKILVFQEPLHYRPIDHREIEEEMNITLKDLRHDQDVTQEHVIDVLRHYGHKALIINTANKQLSEEAIKQLTSFAYRPKRFPED